MGSLVVNEIRASAGELAARSSRWRAASAPRLFVGVPTDEAVVLGQFQRTSEIAGDHPFVRRGSGGGAARVGPSTVWMGLALPRVDALVSCSADKILNRYVRPLLRALTRVANVHASYFGRDWVSAAHRPVALCTFAHDAATNAALFEAIVAVSTPMATAARASFLGKAPGTLEEIAGRSIEAHDVVTSIIDAYAAIADTTTLEDSAALPPEMVVPEPPWIATREEAIGTLGAGHDIAGRLRIGGELMASTDAIARLEAAIAALANPSVEEVGRVVDEALTTGGAVTFGVRSLASIRDVILEALGQRQPSGTL